MPRPRRLRVGGLLQRRRAAHQRIGEIDRHVGDALESGAGAAGRCDRRRAVPLASRAAIVGGRRQRRARRRRSMSNVEPGQPEQRCRARAAPSSRARLAERLHDAVERLHAALAVDERAGGLGERRDRQQHVGVLRAVPERRQHDDELGLLERGARRDRIGAVELGLGAAARGRPCADRRASPARSARPAAAARRRRSRRRCSRPRSRQPSVRAGDARPAPAPARSSCDASGCCSAKLPSRIALRSPRRAGSRRSPAPRRRLDAGQRRRAPACPRPAPPRRRSRPARAAAATARRRTSARRGISESSSTECSIETCAPFFAAWRSRCASSGWSLRRKLPTTSTRSSASSSAIGMPSQGTPAPCPSPRKSVCRRRKSMLSRAERRARAARRAPSPRASRAARPARPARRRRAVPRRRVRPARDELERRRPVDRLPLAALA